MTSKIGLKRLPSEFLNKKLQFSFEDLKMPIFYNQILIDQPVLVFHEVKICLEFCLLLVLVFGDRVYWAGLELAGGPSASSFSSVGYRRDHT